MTFESQYKLGSKEFISLKMQKFHVFFHFEGGRWLWPLFSQPVFISCPLLRGPLSIQTKNITLEGMPCRSYIGAPRYVNCTYYQMDHIWWAPRGLKKSLHVAYILRLRVIRKHFCLSDRTINKKDPVGINPSLPGVRSLRVYEILRGNFQNQNILF